MGGSQRCKVCRSPGRSRNYLDFFICVTCVVQLPADLRQRYVAYQQSCARRLVNSHDWRPLAEEVTSWSAEHQDRLYVTTPVALPTTVTGNEKCPLCGAPNGRTMYIPCCQTCRARLPLELRQELRRTAPMSFDHGVGPRPSSQEVWARIKEWWAQNMTDRDQETEEA